MLFLGWADLNICLNNPATHLTIHQSQKSMRILHFSIHLETNLIYWELQNKLLFCQLTLFNPDQLFIHMTQLMSHLNSEFYNWPTKHKKAVLNISLLHKKAVLNMPLLLLRGDRLLNAFHQGDFWINWPNFFCECKLRPLSMWWEDSFGCSPWFKGQNFSPK